MKLTIRPTYLVLKFKGRFWPFFVAFCRTKKEKNEEKRMKSKGKNEKKIKRKKIKLTLKVCILALV